MSKELFTDHWAMLMRWLFFMTDDPFLQLIQFLFKFLFVCGDSGGREGHPLSAFSQRFDVGYENRVINHRYCDCLFDLIYLNSVSYQSTIWFRPFFRHVRLIFCRTFLFFRGQQHQISKQCSPMNSFFYSRFISICKKLWKHSIALRWLDYMNKDGCHYNRHDVTEEGWLNIIQCCLSLMKQ